MLDFRIETFLCVCKHMNYTRAAKELGLTQPGVSQHIHFLEEYYNSKLFTYKKRVLTLTPSGLLLKNAMESMRHDTIRLQSDIANQNQTQEINIGASLSIGGFILPERLAAFITANPNIKVSLTIADTQKLVDELNSGKLDFAFVEGFFNKENFDFKLAGTDNMVCVCGTHFPVDSVKTVEDLFSYPLLVREKGSGTREVFTRFLNEHGYSIDNFSHYTTINNILVILKMLEYNHGISFLYQAVVEESIKKGTLKLINIPNFSLSHEYNAIWRKNSLFANVYKEIAEQLM